MVPELKPVMDVVGEREFDIVPLPEINVHTPDPTRGELAAITADGDEIQIV